MMKGEFKNELTCFKIKLESYRDLLLDSRDQRIARIIRNFDEIDRAKEELNLIYGGLEEDLSKFISSSCFRTALSNVPLNLRGRSLDDSIQEVQIAIGRLDRMDDEAFDDLMNPQKPPPDFIEVRKSSDKKFIYTSPLFYLLLIGKWVKGHLKISILIAILTLLSINYNQVKKNVTDAYGCISSKFQSSKPASK